MQFNCTQLRFLSINARSVSAELYLVTQIDGPEARRTQATAKEPNRWPCLPQRMDLSEHVLFFAGGFDSVRERMVETKMIEREREIKTLRKMHC